MEDNLKRLYKEVILKHSKHPFHYEKKEDVTLVIEAYNPLCGDQFTLYLDWDGDTVSNCWFHGHGCAISKASASVLTKKLQGLSKEAVKDLLKNFYCVVSPDSECDGLEITDEELLAFGGTVAFPERLKCATLSWDHLKKELF